ncbi:MAG: maleylpyruvate isomerase family mycothiol-dependent enzyme [Chloroflexi bacterium]|nr:maleylpyruvate isomerase family mycothiol-dependent enzyme [Chloroflexota bacterium]
MRPLQPIDVIHLFPEERAALLALLESLSPDDWRRPTVCAGWSVQDLAAHVLGDDLGSVARGRDGYSDSWIDASSFDALVAAINELNEAWVRAMRRLSPQLLCEMLRFSGERVFAYFASLDLAATGGPVDWAGPGPAPVWLDVAREYTERWAHQQQIRDALARPGLTDRRLFAPVIDAYVRALPHTFRDTPAPDATHVRVDITGHAGGAWSLLREGGRWSLYAGDDAPAAARVTLDQDTAWRLFTKGITPAAARPEARLEGDPALAEQVLQTVSVLA